MKKIFSIPYILKAHTFCITLENAHTSLNTCKLTAKGIYYEKCIFTTEKSIIYPRKIQICFIENFEIWLYSELDSKRGFGDFVLNSASAKRKLIAACF